MFPGRWFVFSSSFWSFSWCSTFCLNLSCLVQPADLGGADLAAQDSVNSPAGIMMNGYHVTVLNFNDNIKSGRGHTLQHCLLCPPPPRLDIGPSPGFWS